MQSRQPDLEVMCLNLNDAEVVQHVHSAIWVWLLGSLEDRCLEDRCFWSVMSTNAARYQMAPIQFVRNDELRRLTGQPKLTAVVQSRHMTFLDTLRVWTTTQMPRASCQLSLQRTGGDLEDAPTSHGWAPYSRIWDHTISHCLKQWIRPRTGLCGGCGRRPMLHNLELYVRNDDVTCFTLSVTWWLPCGELDLCKLLMHVLNTRIKQQQQHLRWQSVINWSLATVVVMCTYWTLCLTCAESCEVKVGSGEPNY